MFIIPQDCFSIKVGVCREQTNDDENFKRNSQKILPPGRCYLTLDLADTSTGNAHVSSRMLSSLTAHVVVTHKFLRSGSILNRKSVRKSPSDFPGRKKEVTTTYKPGVFHTARACEGCLENQGLVCRHFLFSPREI